MTCARSTAVSPEALLVLLVAVKAHQFTSVCVGYKLVAI